MAKIIVACGSGVASSEATVGRINDFFEKHSITGVQVDATDFKQLPGILADYDVYVWIAKPNEELEDIAEKNNIAMVNGMPIFMNVNPEKSYGEIIQALKAMQS
jgi:PTS system galactitol-specific IIB component